MLEQLSLRECWQLLDEAEIGRVAVLVDGAPEIFPVNHAVDDQTIVFRTAAGSKLRGLAQSPSVCFEVDGVSSISHTGWSVLVKGKATELRTAEETSGARRLPLEYWAQGEKDHWIRIRPLQVTGRRIYLPRSER